MIGIALAAISQAHAEDGKTTILRSRHGTTVITQSGDPATASVHVERKPGSTTITRKSGGNSTTIIQGTEPIDPDEMPMTPAMRRMLDLMR